MTIQPAFRPADERAVNDLLGMMEDFYAIDGYPFHRATAENNIRHFLATPSLGRIWIILHESSVVGYVILTFYFSFEFKGKTAFIDELFVKNDYRSRGIGARTIDFMVEQAKALQINALHLEVERHNEKGNQLYLNKGFTLHNRHMMTKPIY